MPKTISKCEKCRNILGYEIEEIKSSNQQDTFRCMKCGHNNYSKDIIIENEYSQEEIDKLKKALKDEIPEFTSTVFDYDLHEVIDSIFAQHGLEKDSLIVEATSKPDNLCECIYCDKKSPYIRSKKKKRKNGN